MTEDPRRGAIREIKLQAQNMKNLLALAETLAEPADLEKQAAELRAEIAALKLERSNYTSLQGEIAAAKSTLAQINAEIDATRARLK